MIKAVIFDLDGTLVNSLYDLGESTNFALKQMGFPTHPTEAFKYFVGDGIPKLIERAVPENRRDPETQSHVLDIFMRHYKEHYADNTAPYVGIPQMLEQLTAKGIKTAVVSNKAHSMAVTVTEKLFGNKFSLVCGKREDFPSKPDPALTLWVAREIGVRPEECLFVGDSGMDMKAAKNAGCVAVGVLWGFREREELLLNGADCIIDSPNEILRVTEDEK